MATKLTRDRNFILNEPVQKIKNSDKRRSVTVSAKAFPARVQRDQINAVLLAHDFNTMPDYTLSEKDLPLLSLIAAEGAISGNIPALRYHAIGHLASFQSATVFNILSDMASHGEDHYIRSYASQALGDTGIEMAIPVLTQNGSDEDSMVRLAARKGLLKLIRTLGMERVQVYYKGNPGLDSKIFKSIVKTINQPVVPAKGQTKTNRIIH